MKNQLKCLVFLVLITFFLGCATYRAYYDIVLKEVERPVEAKERYGEQKITKVEEEGIFKYYFEDQMVEIIWMPTSSQISFMLKNKTNHSIKIVWDEAAYVDENGESHRVIHSGVKYIDRNNPQPPSVVVRGGTISDIIIPSDKIYYVSGQYGGWRKNPLFPTTSEEFDFFKKLVKKYVGKTIQVLLPLQIEDVINEYIFTFEIKDAEVRKPPGCISVIM
ncbi:hypothetical protein DRO69_02755 [Candidatus Bathyarchaeota archaeon]|nr:MAG: hypothetical protein DRO69_02755 [Candidatus Bathyarchaeota archaeon]